MRENPHYLETNCQKKAHAWPFAVWERVGHVFWEILLIASLSLLLMSVTLRPAQAADPDVNFPAFKAFCARHPADCSPNSRAVVLKFDDALLARLEQVNREVNNRVKPVLDKDQYGVEDFWTYPTGNTGDCEDYTLEKRRLLIAAGFDRSSLLMTIVRNGDARQKHMILVVRTRAGDLALDNLTPDIRWLQDTGYPVFAVQDPQNQGRFVRWPEKRHE